MAEDDLFHGSAISFLVIYFDDSRQYYIIITIFEGFLKQFVKERNRNRVSVSFYGKFYQKKKNLSISYIDQFVSIDAVMLVLRIFLII